jgi:protein-disulfide isomerase-like protein with CxxC motif
MEVTFYEDPACSWCWAFQPVSTTFTYEFGEVVQPRRVMGGLRDRPAADAEFVVRQWKKAEAVSGMPFDCRIWKKHLLRTTFVACRVVKAASMIDELSAHRLLRRLREAQFVEQTPIDDLETVIQLGAELGIDTDQLRENIASGRAEAVFARDRVEAAQHGFGFPTILLRNGDQEKPILLQGAVPYDDIVQALYSIGISHKQRQPFRDTQRHWERVFAIHPRLTLVELQKVTQMPKPKLLARLEQLGIHRHAPFYTLPEPDAPSRAASEAPHSRAAAK